MGRLAKLARRLTELSNAAGMEVSFRRVRHSKPSRRVIYFLHIGKAAGSQINQAMKQINAHERGVQVVPLTHHDRLIDLPREADYFFSIRQPHSRFRSGFYSRKRMGRPLNDIPHTEAEALAFAAFPHANDLAEALFAPGRRGMEAVAAMKAIIHTAQDQIDWFALVGNIFDMRQPIWIVRQEHFDADFEHFLDRAGIAHRPDIRRDAKRSHANDYSEIPPLSGLAMDNLRRWYAQDYAFYEAVETWMARENG